MADKSTKFLLVAAFFSLVAIFSIFKICDFDIWTHLSAGRYIVQNHTIPHTNLFSYTNEFKPMIYDEWLFQIFMYAVYCFSGINGLIILRVILALAIFLILYLTVKRKNIFLIIPVLTLCLMVTSHRILLRPEILSCLFIAAYMYVFIEKADNKWALYAIPVIQLIWANMHGYFLIGLIMILIFCIGNYFETKNFNANLWFILLFSIFASFLNPSGYKGFISPIIKVFELAGTHNILKYTIIELSSPFNYPLQYSYWIFAYKLLLATSSASFLLNFRHTKIALALLFLLFGGLSITAERNVAMFSIVAVVIIIFNVDLFVRNTTAQKWNIFVNRFIKNGQVIFGIVLLVFIMLIGVNIITNRYYIIQKNFRRFGFGVSELIFPDKATDFIKQNNIDGNMFNNFSLGGYLSWKLFPDKKVFIDGRTDSYGIEYYKFYSLALFNRDVFNETIEKYKIKCFTLVHRNEENTNIIRWLYNDHSWNIVYFDELAVIFLKNDVLNKKIIDSSSIKFQNTDKKLKLQLTQFADENNYSLGYYFKGMFFAKIDRYADAIPQFEAAIRLHDDPLYYFKLALVYNKLGLTDKFYFNYNKALALQADLESKIFVPQFIYKRITLFERLFGVARGNYADE